MTEFSYKGDGTRVTWKHAAHEDTWYVDRVAENADALAERAKRIRNSGGTRDLGDGKVVATIPTEVFYKAHVGLSHGGKYKGFMSCDHDTMEKLMSKFFLEDDVKIYMLNDNYRV